MASPEQDPRRRKIHGHHVSVASDDTSQTGKRIKECLPEDIWLHICSFLSMKDAARSACVSRAFQSSWKYRPNLSFRMETVGYNDYNSKVGRILRSHSGVGVKTLHLVFYGPYDGDTNACLDSWLQTGIAPGIEGLSLVLLSSESVPFYEEPKYEVPFSLLSDGRQNSIRDLKFVGCAFHPTAGGCMRSLTNLSLSYVHITGDELGFFLSSSFRLEQLDLSCCSEIISLKIPCLQRLRCLKGSHCDVLQVIESRAPNISSFHFHGDQQVQLLLGESLQVKKIVISHPCVLRYARVMLPSIIPNLETLTIFSALDEVYTLELLGVICIWLVVIIIK